MTKRLFAVAALAILLVPAVAAAQIRQVSSSSSEGIQTVNFSFGYFALKGLDSRAEDDVLLNDLQNGNPLLFEIGDFNSFIFGGEYQIGIGRNFEAGVGVGYTQRTVPSVYRDLTKPSGAEIQQDLKLKQVPVSFTGRFLFLPRGSVVEPYVGGGLVAIKWKYSEIGDFVDENNDIFPARFLADGTAVGPTLFGGLRAPFGHWTVGGEVRWQKAKGDIPNDAGFLTCPTCATTSIDLGGWTTNFSFGVRF
jgi:opacity protein-like surface antigen